MTAIAPDDIGGRLGFSFLLRLVAAVLVGVLIGLGVTIRSLDLDQRGIETGPWRGTPVDGNGESDPYALAANSRAGLLPLGASEGLTFLAHADDTGSDLDSDCDYAVTGPMPPTRFWTLSLLDPHGFPIANPAERYVFTSDDILRFSGDPPTVRVSREARGGNWLPSGKARPFTLMLRLYDTSLSTSRTDLSGIRMPKISRVGCR